MRLETPAVDSTFPMGIDPLTPPARTPVAGDGGADQAALPSRKPRGDGEVIARLRAAKLDGEMRRRDRRPCQVGPQLATLAEPRPFAQGVKFTEEEGARPASGESPEGLRGCEREMRDERGEEPGGRQIGPEQDLRVPRHPTLERGPGVLVAGRDLVEDPAMRGENAVVAGPAEPERQVDVLVVRTERGVERTDPEEGLGAVEARTTRWRRRRGRSDGRPSGWPAGRGPA